MRKNTTKFTWLLALYFLLSLVARVSLSGGLELDESEQILLAQVPRLGYGPQPPLYTWLQYLVFSLFGQTIFSLSLIKSVLLFITFKTIYPCLLSFGKDLISTMLDYTHTEACHSEQSEETRCARRRPFASLRVT